MYLLHFLYGWAHWKVLVICNFGTFPTPKIAGTINYFVILPKQILWLRYVVHICRGCGNYADKVIACIYSDVILHPKSLLVSILGGWISESRNVSAIFVELGELMMVALTMVLSFIMCPVCIIIRLTESKKQIVPVVGFLKKVNFAQRCFIRHGFRHEVNACEFKHGITAIYSTIGSRVGQIKLDLRRIHR